LSPLGGQAGDDLAAALYGDCIRIALEFLALCGRLVYQYHHNDHKQLRDAHEVPPVAGLSSAGTQSCYPKTR
jgi:hypothetical protein